MNITKEKYKEHRRQAIKDRMPPDMYNELEPLFHDAKCTAETLTLLHIVMDKLMWMDADLDD
jgi:hypothetical protein